MPNTYPRHAPTLSLGPTHTRYYCETCDVLRSESEVTDEPRDAEDYVATLCDVCGQEVEYHDDVPVDDDGNELEGDDDADEGEEGDDDAPHP